MLSTSSASSPRPANFVTANIVSANAIKTSIATAASIQTYTGGALNGAHLTPYPDSKTGYAQWPTATASSSAGSYINGSTIVFTGTYNGVVTTRTATVVGTDGNAVFMADGPLDGAVTSIVVGAQTNTGGAWTFGWDDLQCPYRINKLEAWREVRAGSSANIAVVLPDGSVEVLPCVPGEHQPIMVHRIRRALTTATPITLYE